MASFLLVSLTCLPLVQAAEPLFKKLPDPEKTLPAPGESSNSENGEEPEAFQYKTTRHYIQSHWKVLTRGLKDIPSGIRDAKLSGQAGDNILYIPKDENTTFIRKRLAHEIAAKELSALKIMTLPTNGQVPAKEGLLYLPNAYVVPGGRFNAMFGWDSYFIQLGLIRDGNMQLAQDIADNFLYEVRHYGKVLNANISYYLGRSQPPFLSDVVLNVYQARPESVKNRQWLKQALPLIEKDYTFWTSGQHLIADIGLSRYFALGEGPAPEVVASELDDQGLTHYERVRRYFAAHRVEDYREGDYFNEATGQLTPLYFVADRTMRESGFDPSNRFGPFNADILNYAPVCLNSLLYRTERNLASIYQTLGEPAKAQQWTRRAHLRRSRINTYLWDETTGLYSDYNAKEKYRRYYPFATTFFPLWAGLSSAQQAKRLQENLSLFETAAGLRTSTTRSGNQWDSPFGWAPLQLIAVEGLDRYGYRKDAVRLSGKFLSLVSDNFKKTGTIFEKYDVEAGTSSMNHQLEYGYTTNEVGFGWTNGVFDVMLDRYLIHSGTPSTALPPQ